MRRNLSAFFFFLAASLFAQTLSLESEFGLNRPHISNPDFSICENIVKVSFNYSDVAGSICDARITLVLSVPINRQMDRLEPFRVVLGGWKGLFWSEDDNFKLTSGKV